MEDGSKVAGLFNLGEDEARMTVDWSDLGLKGNQAVRDLWRQQNLGAFSNQFQATVPRHGVVLIKLSSKG
jgi:alpha-galactosidase